MTILKNDKTVEKGNISFICKSRLLLYMYRVLLLILFFPAFYYFSLSFESIMQIKNADRFKKQEIKFSKKESGQYLFGKDINFTPEMATYLSSGGRLYIYLKESVVNRQDIQNILIEIIRTNLGEIKKYPYQYSDAEEAVEKYQRAGFHSLAFPSVKLHIDYNDIQVKISGITLPTPSDDAEIILAFSGIKRRIRYMTYLFRGCILLVGGLLILFLHFLIRRKIIKKQHICPNKLLKE